MSAKFFIDTSVFVYSFDDAVPAKRRAAQSLIGRALSERSGAISFQVIQEFLNVSLKKFKISLTESEARDYLQKVLKPLCQVHSTIALYSSALSIQSEYGFSWYDSIIVASAISAACDTLYSEDLQHEQEVRGLTIRNPFLT